MHCLLALVFYELYVVCCRVPGSPIAPSYANPEGRTLTNMCFSLDLDRSNVSNAYVSGMREDLHMFGTQFNVCIGIVNTAYMHSTHGTARKLIRSSPAGTSLG